MPDSTVRTTIFLHFFMNINNPNHELFSVFIKKSRISGKFRFDKQDQKYSVELVAILRGVRRYFRMVQSAIIVGANPANSSKCFQVLKPTIIAFQNG